MRIILRRIISLATLVCFSLMSGCESTPQSTARVLIRTPLASYHADDTIRVDVTNLSGSPVYYICNGQIRLQHMEENQVRTSWDIRGLDTCIQRKAILLGEIVSLTILAEEMDSAAADSRFVSGGTYRFQIDLYKDAECIVLLEEESDRLSNNVVITR